MIKKLFLIVIVLIILLIVCSCKNDAPSSFSEATTSSELKNVYLVDDTTNNYVIVKLPRSDKFTDNANEFIKNYIKDKTYEITGERFNLSAASILPESKKPQEVEYYIEIDSNVSFVSSDTISIAFSGIFNKKSAAHPLNLFFALTFDPNTTKNINISDRYVVDSALYNNFAQLAEKQLTEESGGTWSNSWGNFSEEFCSENEFFDGLKHNNKAEPIYWFYSEKGIIFSYSVPYALGDHKEVELSYDILKLKES